MVNDEAPDASVMDSQGMSASCTINPDAFKNILTEDISKDLSCLQTNFEQFLNSVETERRGYLAKPDLINFIKRYYEATSNDIIKGLESLFNINHLLIGKELNYISRDELRDIISLIKIINQKIIRVYPLFKNQEDRSDYLHAIMRTQVDKEAKEISVKLNEIISRRGATPANLKILEVVKNFLKENDFDEVFEKINALLFVKPIFFGGDKENITHLDLKKIIDNLPFFAVTLFDLTKIKYIDFSKQQNMYNLIHDNLKRLETLIHLPANSNDELFTEFDLINLSKVFASSFVDLSKYPNTVHEVKKILVDSRDQTIFSKSFTRKNLHQIFAHAYNVLEEGIFFGKLSEHYKDLIESRLPVTHPMNDYPIASPTESKYLEHFRRIVYNYRFLKGSFETAYYGNLIYRNPDAINEVSMIEYIFRLILQMHGTKMENGDYSFVLVAERGKPEQDDLRVLIMKVRDLLLDKKLVIEGRYVAASENAFMLANLFQYQSNGNKTLELEEATEFAYTLISGMSIGDYLKENLRNVCNSTDKVPYECFKENFFDVLGSKYRNYFPKLFKFVDSDHTSGQKEELIEAVSKFTRLCPDQSLLKDVDMVAILGGLLNIESTLIKFDFNQDNIFDYSELLKAFEVYKPSIESLIRKDSPELMTKLAKDIFLYLVKYREAPNTKLPNGKPDLKGIAKLAKFLLFENKEKITGDRATIASILTSLGIKAKEFRFERGYYDPEGMCKED